VFRARHVPTGALVALKKVVVFEIPNRDERRKCLQEIRILRRCEHPCVIRCFDAWLEDGALLQLVGAWRWQ
jgi:hypothetical protein